MLVIHLFCPCDEIIFVNGFYTNGELLLKLDSYFQLWHKKNIDEPILDPYIWAEIPLNDISSFRNSLCLLATSVRATPPCLSPLEVFKSFLMGYPVSELLIVKAWSSLFLYVKLNYQQTFCFHHIPISQWKRYSLSISPENWNKCINMSKATCHLSLYRNS